MVLFERETCGDLELALRREWLETNGVGGFASSTIIGLNTRRYHGLLVAATKPPVGRMVLLAKLEETLVIDGRSFELSANQYPGTVHPQGFQYLTQFRLDPFPVFTYDIEGVKIEKSVFMAYGENSCVAHYEVKKNSATGLRSSMWLEIRPLIAFRDYHATTRENASINAAVEERPGLASVTPYMGMPTLHVAHNAVELRTTGEWYRNFEYEVERERGLDDREDLSNPFLLRFDLRREASVIASTEVRDIRRVAEYRLTEVSRRRKVERSSPVEADVIRDLVTAADQFVVARGEQKTVIAGYHWFSDWGRDTMISLPGLALATGKFDVARSILRTFCRRVDRGMVPNRFPDAGETPEYNTVDATLWFFEAARAFLKRSGELEFVRQELYPVLAEIVAWHVRGTRFGIKVDTDGLIASGEDGVQLTWMDAKVGDWVVTPRRGKPVEIQALWYNALCVMADFAEKLGDKPEQKRYREMAAAAQVSFNRLFWNAEENCLYDVVGADGTPDAAIRPNQIFVVSLAHGMLPEDRARAVVEKVREHLLTPYGLRTLAASDPNYHGHYLGGAVERDGAYHQGTVWPWLLGPFVTAYVAVNGGSAAARYQAAEWLTPLRNYMAKEGAGQIPEIFDGEGDGEDGTQRGRGCIAQAWSVAEVLRAWVEDVYGM